MRSKAWWCFFGFCIGVFMESFNARPENMLFDLRFSTVFMGAAAFVAAVDGPLRRWLNHQPEVPDAK